MSPMYLWQYLHENRKDSQSLLRTHHQLPELVKSVYVSDEDDDVNNNESTESCNDAILPKKRFVINFDAEDWSKMKSPRDDLLLEGWGHYLCDLLWNQHALPSPYTFKARVNKDLSIPCAYVVISGTCKECSGKGTMKILTPPEENVGVSATWHATDTRGKLHQKRRQLRGNWRSEAGEPRENISCAVYQRGLASTSMELGDVCKGVEELAKVAHMKRSQPHVGSIHEIGADPVYVTYDTPEQLLVYKTHKKSGYTRVVADATAGVVEGIPRLLPVSGLSATLFLYELVLSGKAQIPIAQMISEKQDTVKITSWLRREGEPPNEAVADSSMALLCSFARAFGECHTLKQYIEIQFDFLLEQRQDPAKVFIRKDIAHVMKNVTQWKVWRNDGHKLVKDFYVRCLAVLVQCTAFEEFAILLCNVLTVALSETIGQSDDGEAVPAETCVEVLGKEIGDPARFDIDSLLKEDPKDRERLPFEIPMDEIPQNIRDWVSHVCQEAEKRSECRGNRVSPYYNPTVADKFADYAKDFVLWSAVIVKTYKSPYLRGVAAAAEVDFNDLQNTVLKNEARPLILEKRSLHT
ncbi:hypothetical protein ONE63_009560 [Megalurothrips usitatus]|uniref:Uncharacterized protein n=1 Tax=Megalurothrips usitatus TaxID=439358 RepID=A0AAV7XNL6_9NEOP|nr:hypothetical protein ONE63_009560 [Megalurothrips usitatus]